MNIKNKNTKASISIDNLKNILSSLRDRLVVYVHTPIQLSYLSVLLPSINRSVVLLCNFKTINNSNIPLHPGISCGKFFNEDNSICGCDDVNFVFSEIPTLTERISFYIQYLHPEGIVLLSGESNEEQTWRSLAKKGHIKTL